MYYGRDEAYLLTLFSDVHKDSLPETSDEDGWLTRDERILTTQ